MNTLFYIAEKSYFEGGKSAGFYWSPNKRCRSGESYFRGAIVINIRLPSIVWRRAAPMGIKLPCEYPYPATRWTGRRREVVRIRWGFHVYLKSPGGLEFSKGWGKP